LYVELSVDPEVVVPDPRRVSVTQAPSVVSVSCVKLSAVPPSTATSAHTTWPFMSGVAATDTACPVWLSCRAYDPERTGVVVCAPVNCCALIALAVVVLP
jgi:hypothetical protein